LNGRLSAEQPRAAKVFRNPINCIAAYCAVAASGYCRAAAFDHLVGAGQQR
jgi:hypothetical protein